MKNLLKRFRVADVALVSLLIVGVLIWFSGVYAGTLTNPLKDRMNRLKQNLTTGIKHTVVFKTELAVTGGVGVNKVIMVFPDADDATWCATAGTDLVTADCTEGGATALPGTQTARCVQGAGASNYDTIYVEAVDNLAAATTYCFDVTDGTAGKLGTPAATTTGVITVKTNNGTSDVDTGKLAVDIVTDEQVVVSATVEPSITLTLSTNSINLGTLSTSSVSSQTMTVQTVVNGVGGYSTTLLENNNLWIDASNDINDVAVTGTIDAGTEEYGMSTNDSTDGPFDILYDADCAAVFNADPITSTAQTLAGDPTGPTDETATLCFAASRSSTTTAGSYSHTLTFISTGTF